MVAYTPPNGATDVNNVPVHLKALWDTVVAQITEREATRAPTVHTHTEAQVTGLQATLAAKAPMVHTHPIANVTGLQSALDAKDRDLAARVPLIEMGSFSGTTDANGEFAVATTKGGGAAPTWVVATPYELGVGGAMIHVLRSWRNPRHLIAFRADGGRHVGSIDVNWIAGWL